MEEIEMWLARDEDNSLYLYIRNKPSKGFSEWSLKIGARIYDVVNLNDSLFPEVKWSDDEPTKVKLVIEK